LISASSVVSARAIAATSISAGFGGRYLYAQQIGAQLEFAPLATDWVRLAGGASISYRDWGSILFAGAKIGPEFGWISPAILVGSALTVTDALNSVALAGVNVQVHPIGSWLAFGEVVKAFPSVLDQISIGFGVGYRL
jgi:hypothetical protein